MTKIAENTKNVPAMETEKKPIHMYPQHLTKWDENTLKLIKNIINKTVLLVINYALNAYDIQWCPLQHTPLGSQENLALSRNVR